MILSTSNVAYANEKPQKNLQALDAEFLAFIAQMEKVDDAWVDPMSVENMSFEKVSHEHKKPAASIDQKQPDESGKIVAEDKPIVDDKTNNNEGIK